jgi:hypothetical protein
VGKSKFYWHAQEVSRCRLEVKPGLPPWGPHVRFRRVQTLVREGSPLVKLRDSAQLRLRLPTVPFALGETIELQHDANVVGQ